MTGSIYLPKAFEERDVAVLHDLVEAHSFGMLVAPGDGGAPLLAHLPFVLDRAAGPHGTLLAHVARANPIARAIDAGAQAVAVFRGPHAYVSPGWYTSRNEVPTWNYAVVHAHGALSAIEDEARLFAILDRLTAIHEEGMIAPWTVGELTPEKRGELSQAIVGFAIEVTAIEGKLKLSQNRKPEDRDGAIAGLRARGSPDDVATAEMMMRVRPRG